MKSSLLAPLTLAVALAAAAVASAAPPNILFILADDLGYSDLGCYGGEIATPNLDKLAAGGVRFTQFYNTARCWPSRAAITTGYYAQEVRRDTVPGIRSGGAGVRPAWAPLITTFLQPVGYHTYHSGKWHIDGKPLQNGFERSFEIGGPAQSNFFKAQGNLEEEQPVPQTPDYYVTTAAANHAIKCLADHAAKYPGQPFFHYLAFTAPHFPLMAPAADIAKYRDKYVRGWNVMAEERHARQLKMGLVNSALPVMERDVGPPYAFPDDIAKLGPDEVNRPVPWSELSESQRKFQSAKMAIHAAMVDRMDQEIGRVIWLRLAAYLPWLAWQVVVANLHVARIVLHPRLPIDPCVVRLDTPTPHTLARLTVTNSITLTPGTVTLDADVGGYLVHALTRSAAAAVERGAMHRRVQALFEAPQ